MRLTTLGGLTLEGSDFTRPKPLLLISYLALEGPRERRFVAELFWPRAADHMKSLTVALAQLRSGAPGLVRARGSQIGTEVASDVTDTLELLEQSRYEEALEHYRGAFLEGFYLKDTGEELEEWIYATREFVAERVRSALLALGVRAAGRGSFEQGARRAEAALILRGAAPPLPEQLALLHTLLLAGGHPQARAVREEADLFGLPLADDREQACARLRAAAPMHTAPLPERGSSFVGRDPERAEIGSLLTSDRCSLLSLVGPAGVGKTRLALQIAREQQRLGAFADGVGFASFDSLTDPTLIPQRIAAALGIDLGRDDSLEALARDIGERQILLLIDNFEHLIDRAILFGQLLRACPGLTVLVTSRERLNLEEERIYLLEGLPLPSDPELGLDEARRHDAIDLFVQRARSARPDFDIGAEDLPHLLEICRLVEGLPLGLELAAVWVRVLGCRDIAAELRENLDLLSSSARDAPERHRSIRSAFEHSWRLLSESEQRVLRDLSVFRGGFRREAAGEVAGATIPLLGSLVDKSLLRVAAGERYDRHPLLAQYCLEKLLADPGAAASARERHGRHFVAFLEARSAALSGPDHRDALRALVAELDNLRAAWRWALTEERQDEVARLTAPLANLFDTRSAFREGAELLAEAREQFDRTGGGETLGLVLASLSSLEYRLGRYPEAERSAQQALELLEDSEAWSARARPYNTHGSIATRRGDYPQAQQWFERAVEMARRSGNPHDIARYITNLALTRQLQGDYRAARLQLQEALELKRALDDRRFVVRNLNNLGNLALYLGDMAEAERCFREGLALAEQLEVSEIIPYFTVNLGIVHFDEGRYPEAAELFAGALQQARSSGNRSLEIGALRRLGNTASAVGRFEEARRFLLEALEIARELRALPAQLLTLFALAEWKARQGDPVAALELCGLVLRHDATDPHEKERVRQVIERLRASVDSATATAALERGALLDLDEVTGAELPGVPGGDTAR